VNIKTGQLHCLRAIISLATGVTLLQAISLCWLSAVLVHGLLKDRRVEFCNVCLAR
jgi:hypothetical protein